MPVGGRFLCHLRCWPDDTLPSAVGARRSGFRMRRTSVVVAVLVVLALGVAACVNEADYSGVSGGRRVAILGSEVSAAAAPAVHAVLDPDRQVRMIGVDGTVAAM